jgi:hypothetical protein
VDPLLGGRSLEVHVTTTWRYVLPALADGSDSWSIVFVDSTGAVAVLSDYGNWCYRWLTAHTGFRDFREFLVQVDWDYTARKLGSGRREDLSVYDGDATFVAIRAYIVTARREGTLDAEEAQKEWRLADDSGLESNLVGFHEWYQQTSLPSPYEFAVYRMDHGLKHWATVSLPRLQELIRADLKGALLPSEGEKSN